MKLVYFPGKGALELSRYILAQAGVEYEDSRVTGDAWQALKPSTPFGQLPILDVDGQVYGQSVAIARYFANKYNLAGTTAEEKLLADSIVDTLRADIVTGLLVKMFHEKDEAKKAELKKTATEKLPGYLAGLEKLANSDKAFLTSGLSWADIALFNAVEDFFAIGGELNLGPEYIKLHGIINTVKSLPNIAAWIEKRPASSF